MWVNQTSNFCTTYRGGLYSQSASTSAVSATNVGVAGGAPIDNSSLGLTMYHTDIRIGHSSWVKDDLVVTSNVTLPHFPFAIPRMDWGMQYHSQAALGLGPNSTVLSALRFAGHIRSRTWSMFWGRAGATKATQLDGTFVLGGYDSAKVAGAPFTQNISTRNPNCLSGMLVNIENIQLNFPNGSDTSIFQGYQGNPFAACIEPDFPSLMTFLDFPYFQNFEIMTQQSYIGRSQGINYHNVLFSPQTAYDGDLTIQLDSGLSVRIPNDQLVLPDLYIGANGQVMANNSVREIVVNPLNSTNTPDLPLLGRQFLTAAYAMVNLDANTFTLWQANPTTDERLVAVDTEGNDLSTNCSVTPSSSPSASPSTSPSAISEPHSTSALDDNAKRLSTGAIAGIAVGGVVLLTLAICALLLLARKRKRAAALKQQPARPPTPPYGSRPPLGMQEMAGWNRRGELPANGGHWEMETQERPGELDVRGAYSIYEGRKLRPEHMMNCVYELGSP
ncbi:hypothetical protein LTR50_001926 [Elasticomyces elasticus]|nr:hypothetical protein LTR50_001926 [Elasticomyces elasticus]